MIIDETANLEEAALNTRLSKTSDFGSGCSADGNLIIEASIFDKLVKQLQVEGGYLASDAEKAALREVMWDADGHRTVGHRRNLSAEARPGRRLRDSRRPQVHHRARRRHRQGAPLLEREADYPARRLQIQGLRPGTRHDARRSTTSAARATPAASIRSTRGISIGWRWRRPCPGSWCGSRNRRPTPAPSTTGCR